MMSKECKTYHHSTGQKMTQAQLIEIAEKLNKWLDDVSEEYQIDKIDLQDIIKHFLVG